MGQSMKTSVYIDGFNFYHACFRHRHADCAPADKWLNLRLLANRLAGSDNVIHKVHYFTAYLYRSRFDADQNLRQELYIRALRTLPSVEIHLGKHIPVTRRGVLIQPDPASLGVWFHERAVIETFEEKGSDVNLATQLLDDSYAGIIEHAIVVSNDTDLIAPIKSARRRIRVSVISPQITLAKQLKRVADAAWCLDARELRECRLPNPVIAADGTRLVPPDKWQYETWEELLATAVDEDW